MRNIHAAKFTSGGVQGDKLFGVGKIGWRVNERRPDTHHLLHVLQFFRRGCAIVIADD